MPETRSKKDTLRSAIVPAAVLGILAVLGYYFFGLTPKGDRAEGSVLLGGEEFVVVIADTMAEHAQGLSGKPSLGEREGMLFLFSGSATRTFWMKDMNFPIDIIWIAGDRVAGFAENAKPEPEKTMFSLTLYESPEPVDKVLEVPAGTVARLGVRVGDQVAITSE